MMDSLNDVRQPARLLEPVVDRAVWRPVDIITSNTGIFHWIDEELTEIDRAVEAYEGSGQDLIDINPAHIPSHPSGVRQPDQRN